MPWIKRNLLFVVGLAVAVALLGFGVFYLLGSHSAAAAADQELASKNEEYTQLVDRKPAASQENITAAREQQKKLHDFKDSLRPQFGGISLPEGLDDAAFKNLLDRTTESLEKHAERSGVKLPKLAESTKYAFTFDTQKKQLEFTQKSLVPLTSQLLDIDAICRVLFDSKIHGLESIRRTPVNTNDITPTQNYISKKVSTNSITGAAVFPYEVTFQCFSAELASVLAGLANAQPMFVVKSVNVERGSADMGASSAMGAGMGPGVASRYGLPGRFGAPTAPAAAAPKPGEALLDDKPLRVTINLEVIKLPPPAPATKGKG